MQEAITLKDPCCYVVFLFFFSLIFYFLCYVQLDFNSLSTPSYMFILLEVECVDTSRFRRLWAILVYICPLLTRIIPPFGVLVL